MTDMPDEAIVRLLKNQCFDGVDPGSIETVRTHISLLLLGGETALKLKRPIYRKTTNYGHFGRELAEFVWEKTDKAQALRRAAGVK